MSDTVSTSQKNILGTEKVGKLMLNLGLPAILAQVINVLYNIVDRIYIGHIPDIGSLALTAVGVCAPILMLVSAFSGFVGRGGAPLAAIAMGEGNHEEAEKILGNGVTVLLCLSVILTLFFQIFKRPVLYAFGASDAIIGYAEEYITVYLCGTLSVQLSLGLNMYISAQGRARTAMLSVLIGAVTNIVLDPVFMFVFNMGVRGAALATIVSQTISAAWVLRFLLGKQTILHIRRKYMRLDKRIILKVAALGISPFIMESTESLVNITLNSSMQRYGGDLYVGSITILHSVMLLLTLSSTGFTNGIQPLISYNYGAKNMDRVRTAFKYTCCVVMTFMFVLTGVMCLFPQLFARIFTDDAALIALVSKSLPIFVCGMFVFGVQICCQMMFMGLGMAKQSLFLALMRKVILLVPLAIIIPMLTKTAMSVYYAEPIADITAAAISLTMFLVYRKQLLYGIPRVSKNRA